MDRPVALVTNADLNGLAPDDALLVPALSAIGITSIVVCWDDPTVDWSQFGLVTLRSCWNYHLKWTVFQRWLRLLDTLKVPVLNSVPTLEWNMSKTYLLELASRGVRIPPTVSVARGDGRRLVDIMTRQHWLDAVIKPAISASAYATSRVNLQNAAAQENSFRELCRRGGVLVQQYVPEVVDRGELSFMFLAGHYSHAVLKTPRQGDFRVQTDFGGERALVAPDHNLITQAQRILALSASHVSYARVDAIQVQDTLVLMELELIDPVLFFAFSPPSAKVLARSIEERLM